MPLPVYVRESVCILYLEAACMHCMGTSCLRFLLGGFSLCCRHATDVYLLDDIVLSIQLALDEECRSERSFTEQFAADIVIH